MWPIQLAFRLLISCRIFLCSLTLSNTSSFLTWSVQLISILLQHHVSKLSRYFWSADFTDVSTKIKNVPNVVTNLLFRLRGHSVFEPAICKSYTLTVRSYRVRWSVVTAAFAKPCSGHVNALNIHVFRLAGAQCPVRQDTAPLLLVRFVVYDTFTVPLKMFLLHTILVIMLPCKLNFQCVCVCVCVCVCACVCVSVFCPHTISYQNLRKRNRNWLYSILITNLMHRLLFQVHVTVHH